jgi:general secretion pathway protein G
MTLVELLVVIAVTGILAALLFPALMRGRQRVDAARCAQNLRQIGIGMRLYADADAAGRLPGDDRPGPRPIGMDPGPVWIFNLSNTLGDVNRIRVCPSDALRSWIRTNFSCSYVLNEYTSTERRSGPLVMSGVTDPDGGMLQAVPTQRRLDLLPNPSATMLVFEASELGQRIGDARTHPDTWFLGWSNVVADIDPSRHGRGANYLFADGHVEMIPASVLRTRVENGENPAVPPR